MKEYNSKKNLTIPKNDFTITEIEDIAVIERPHESNDLVSVKEALIVGVLTLDSYKSCLNIKARVEQLSPPEDKCTSNDCPADTQQQLKQLLDDTRLRTTLSDSQITSILETPDRQTSRTPQHLILANFIPDTRDEPVYQTPECSSTPDHAQNQLIFLFCD